jgi:hypothetical protein
MWPFEHCWSADFGPNLVSYSWRGEVMAMFEVWTYDRVRFGQKFVIGLQVVSEQRGLRAWDHFEEWNAPRQS